MKIHWAILKKPKFILGFIVLFFVLLFLLNRSGSKAATNQVVQTGPDPATVAAQTQLALAQISAGVQGQAIQADFAKAQDANAAQIQLAAIAAAVSNNQTAAQTAIAQQTVSAQVHGLDLQYQTALANNAAQIQAMIVQSNYGLANTAIMANLQSHLADLQAGSYNLGQELAHVNDVRLHGGQRLAVLQNIINTSGNVFNANNTNPTVNIPQLTAAGTLA